MLSVFHVEHGSIPCVNSDFLLSGFSNPFIPHPSLHVPLDGSELNSSLAFHTSTQPAPRGPKVVHGRYYNTGFYIILSLLIEGSLEKN